MNGRPKPSVVDVEGSSIGDLTGVAGENYAAIERSDVTWFVPGEMIEHPGLGPSVLKMRTSDIARIDLLSGLLPGRN